VKRLLSEMECPGTDRLIGIKLSRFHCKHPRRTWLFSTFAAFYNGYGDGHGYFKMV